MAVFLSYFAYLIDLWAVWREIQSELIYQYKVNGTNKKSRLERGLEPVMFRTTQTQCPSSNRVCHEIAPKERYDVVE